jgi:hypothetical protein
VTNGIKVGDMVQIPEGMTMILGKVSEIDDHPLEYAQLKLSLETPAGTLEVWKSCRLARKF